MITGTVSPGRELVIRLQAKTADQVPFTFNVVVDTGFNGFLTLPSSVLQALGATHAGTRRAALGDGKIVELDVYLVTVLWHESELEVMALGADASPLLGMSLLWNNRVSFEARDGGMVIIEEVP